MFYRPNICSEALVLTRRNVLLTLTEEIVTYQATTESRFNEAKRAAGLGVENVMIGKIPISANMEWSDFEHQRQRKLEIYSVYQKTDALSNLEESYLSGNALEAYKACVKHNRGTGVYLDIQNGSPDRTTIVIVLSLVSLGGDDRLRTLKWYTSNFVIDEGSLGRLQEGLKGTDSLTIFGERQNVDDRSVFAVDVNNAGADGSKTIETPARARLGRRFFWERERVQEVSFHQSGGNTPSRSFFMSPSSGWFFKDSIPVAWHTKNVSGDIRNAVAWSVNQPNGFAYVVNSYGGRDASATFVFTTREFKEDYEDITDLPYEQQLVPADGTRPWPP